MATVTGFTADRMLAIENSTVVSGAIVSDDLILQQRDGTSINAGRVKGDPGDPGDPGPPGVGPTGSISMFAGTGAPSGHLICDGTAISRTTYEALFAVIGTQYGSGDGSTTFNLPNLKGRVPIGYDPNDTQFDTLGEAGGSSTHVLTATEMPVHTHVQNSHNHTQTSHNHTQNSHNHTQNGHDHGMTEHSHASGIMAGYMTYGSVGRTRVAPGSSTDRIAITATDVNQLGISLAETSATTTNPHTGTATNQAATAANNAATAVNNAVTATNQTAGSGDAHNNLQPYLVLNYIIKT